ncbi:hypothetical protein [Acetivibrio saccincola]|uniref:hypothetical protein n=1 Tax=Acetivibrio saccincola TaxID=1677857 RepID=UPI00131BE727|nr:hypothetical protein [Acetivibrio saccincola]HQD29155.1 hypothetical protein [Acetivibrio saccincola]
MKDKKISTRYIAKIFSPTKVTGTNSDIIENTKANIPAPIKKQQKKSSIFFK